MDNDFKQIKQAEQDAELLLAEAKEKISAIKKGSIDKIKLMEDHYYSDLKKLQQAQQAKESAALAAQISALDAQWQAEKKGLDKSTGLLRADLIRDFVGKVINAYGDSSC